MSAGRTHYSRKFAWLPTRVRGPRGHQIVIWLKRYYEKKVYVESLAVTGWLVYRSLKPFPSRSHLKVIK